MHRGIMFVYYYIAIKYLEIQYSNVQHVNLWQCSMALQETEIVYNFHGMHYMNKRIEVLKGE